MIELLIDTDILYDASDDSKGIFIASDYKMTIKNISICN